MDTGLPEPSEPAALASRTNTFSYTKSDPFLAGTGSAFASENDSPEYHGWPFPTPTDDSAAGYRLITLADSPLDRTANCDVIFVHGLSGGEDSTWRCGSFFWPEALLKQHRRARVLMFAYDRKVWTNRGIRVLEQVVQHLLYQVTLSRHQGSDAARRPIIWVAHSLGGCLVKAALTLSKRNSHYPFLSDIYQSSRAIVFFGTPHRARTIIGWHKMVHRINTASQDRDEVGMETAGLIEKEESMLSFLTLLSTFDQSLSTSNLTIYSFFEKHETCTESIAALVTTGENALNDLHEKVDYLYGNHITMCQFPSTSEPGYCEVSDIIKTVSSHDKFSLPALHDFLSNISHGAARTPPSDLEKYLVDLQTKSSPKDGPDDLESLATKSIRREDSEEINTQVARLFLPTVKLRRVKRILTAPIFGFEYIQSLLVSPELNEWISKSDTMGLRDWVNDRFMLLITGPLGAGKSSAAYQVVSYLGQELGSPRRGRDFVDGDDIVLHHFFNTQSDPEGLVSEMINQFLLQILEINPSMVRHFPNSKIFARAKRRPRWPHQDIFNAPKPGELKKTPSGINADELQDEHGLLPLLTDDELLEIMLSMLRSNRVMKKYVIIDGLDECDDESQRTIIEFIKQLKDVENVKMCITCKQDSRLEEDLKAFEMDTISVNLTQQEEYKSAVATFADNQVKNLVHQLVGVRRLNLPSESRKKISKLSASEVSPSYLWIRLATSVLKGVRNIPYLNRFIDFLVPDTGARPDIASLNLKIVEFLVEHREHSAVLAMFFVAFARQPLKSVELSLLVATSLCLKQTAEEKDLNTAIPTLESQTSNSGFLSSYDLQQKSDPGSKFWNWVSSSLYVENSKRIDREAVDLEVRADRDQWPSVELLDIMSFQGGVISLAHPSLKDSIISYIDSNPEHSQALHMELAASCLTALSLPRRSNTEFKFDPVTREHSPPIEEYDYALKHWHRHLAQAGPAGKELHDLVVEAWKDKQFREPLLQLSRKKYPRRTAVDVFCLYAALDLEHMLTGYTPPSTDEVPLPLVCAVANAASNSSDILTKSIFAAEANTTFDAWNTQGYINQLDNLAELTGNVEFFQKWKKLMPHPETTQPGEAAVEMEPQSSMELDVTESRSRLQKAIASGNTEEIQVVLRSFNGGEALLTADDLTLAIRHGNAAVLKNLIDTCHVDVNMKLGDSKRSMLHLCAATGSLDIVRLLVRYRASKSATDIDGMKPIHRAAERGHAQVVKYLLTTSFDVDKSGQTPLFNACSCGSLSTIRVLLDHGLSINVSDKEGRRPLHIAASAGAKSTVRLLLIEGADPNVRDKEDLTPLHVAAYGGWEEVVSELLSSGAVVDRPTRKKLQTPLHMAALSKNPTLSIVFILLKAGADPNKEDFAGRKPLQLAIEHGSVQMVSALLEKTKFATLAAQHAFLAKIEQYREKKSKNVQYVHDHGLAMAPEDRAAISRSSTFHTAISTQLDDMVEDDVNDEQPDSTGDIVFDA